MPNAAKLVAALCLAAVGFFGAVAVVPHMPEGQRVGKLWLIAVLAGVLVGWRMLGRDMTPRRTLTQVEVPGAASTCAAGLRAAALTAICTLFAASTVVMFIRAFDRRYKGPMDAVVSIFDLCLGYAPLFTHVDVLLTLAIGGILAAYAARGAGRAWG
ncbi:TrgA family protein [Frigidibacter sp. MR17.24]|uniref:TrgA family protein n=1 Tax=Frigidibacter sp. MR17.24 TaxID=3127345 RepID=UPI003012F5DF